MIRGRSFQEDPGPWNTNFKGRAHTLLYSRQNAERQGGLLQGFSFDISNSHGAIHLLVVEYHDESREKYVVV